ncbi:response regulator transcription factor [bacterium]|nr:MAG: response regulator transcription factor [bacterium]
MPIREATRFESRPLSKPVSPEETSVSPTAANLRNQALASLRESASTPIIEDDRDIANLVQLHLRDLNMEVDVVHDGSKGWEMLSTSAYELVVLDIALPGMDGLEICRRLRARPQYTTILMLTSKDTELDRVLGLELGADDYLTKPFSIRELLARVKALFRRGEALDGASGSTANLDCPAGGSGSGETTIQSGELFIETDKRKVLLKGESVALTAKEFDLLHLFACHPGRVYTRTQLLDSVWGLGFEGYEHTVNSHINRLRNKIEMDPAHPRYLLTVWGVGYKFTEGGGENGRA